MLILRLYLKKVSNINRICKNFRLQVSSFLLFTILQQDSFRSQPKFECYGCRVISLHYLLCKKNRLCHVLDYILNVEKKIPGLS